LGVHSFKALIRSIGRGLGFAGASAIGAAGAAKAAHAKRRDAVDAEDSPESYRKRLLAGFSRDKTVERRNLQDPIELPVVTGQEPDQDKAIMARITAAVAAREQAELVGSRELGDDEGSAPSLGGVTREEPIADELMDLPHAVEEPSEPLTRVQADKKPRRKSTKARAEEQPRLFKDDNGEFILSMTTALRARSSQFVPALLLPCMSWNQRPVSKPLA